MTESSGALNGAVDSRTIWHITIGSVSIVFERDAGQPIHLTVNGDNYGTLQSGDELLIDENRAVIVNGVTCQVVAEDSVEAHTEESTTEELPTPSESTET
jgi:hypothetical protein